MLQLKSVTGSYIFIKPACFRHEPHLWRTFSFYELTLNHRQRDDPLLNICNALRLGELTLQQIEVLKSREIDPAKPNYHQMMAEFEHELHIFPTNKLVQKHNAKCAAKLRQRTTVYTIKSVDTYADGPQSGQSVDEAFVPSETKNCAGIAAVLNLGIGSRVMLLRNVDVGGKLCNGSMGTVVAFQWRCLRQNPRSESCEMPASVEVQFDEATSSLLNERGNYEVVPQSFRFPGKMGKNISRFQLPLAEACAFNVHKVQSLSLDRAVVYLGKRHFAKGIIFLSIEHELTTISW